MEEIASVSNSSHDARLQAHQHRLDRARTAMVEKGIDILLVGPGSDLIYLIGYDAHLSERLNLLGLPAQGIPFLVVPRLEAPTVPAVTRELCDLKIWEETESPTALVGQLVAALDATKPGVSEQLWSGFLLKLQSEMPNATWSSAQTVMLPMRLQKDSTELAILAEASRLTDEAWHEFIEGGPISGLTESEAIDRLFTAMRKRGLAPEFGICASGAESASPHHHTGDRVVQQGDVVVFDFGGKLHGYYSDVTRTVFIGQPTEEFRKVYDIVKRANQATFEAVKPGVPCEEIDRVARDLISAAGYGEQFIHRVGHGLGLDVHEDPYLVSGNKLPLAPGMVFSDEPGIYLEGKFGVRIEDTVVCTEDGAIKLNHATRELTVMD